MQIKNNEKGVSQIIVMPFSLREKLVEAAKEKDQSISSLVCEAIEKKLTAEKECNSQAK